MGDMQQVSYRKLTNIKGHWIEFSRPGSVYPWPNSKSREAGGKLTNMGLKWQRSAYCVLLAKFRQLTQPADVQILSNASCTSDATSSVIIFVSFCQYMQCCMFSFLEDFPHDSRQDSWWASGTIIMECQTRMRLDAVNDDVKWRHSVLSQARGCDPRAHTPSSGYSSRVVEYAWCSGVRCVLVCGYVIRRSGT
jgi:hypothetical protein